MAVKKCCVNTCGSCSSRKEDLGVTYHKFPKDSVLCGEWLDVTRHTITEQRSYVCSRHFCKTDFQIYKGSKYVLKSDAIPSIFPWLKVPKNKRKQNIKIKTKMEVDSDHLTVSDNTKETNNSIDNIPKEEYPILFNESGPVDSQAKDVSVDDIDNKIESILSNSEVENGQSTAEKSTSENEGDRLKSKEAEEENVAVASSVMEMILSESEAKLAKKKDFKILTNNDLSPSDKGNSMALSVGSKVEAKDFGEDWYPAQIMEVDYDEMEVLVHYENDSKKHDEWISVSSPRLRPINSLSTTVQEGSASKPATKEQSPAPVTVKEEIKQEDKPKVEFAVGERCLARYRDNRRFMATVSADLGEGQFEIIFDDGARWTCAMSRLCKLKDTMKKGPLTVDTTLAPSASSTPSPDMVPIGNALPLTPHPAYHTHLFDPARDYLGSKSERRELKRKLNIKEIFNIGQKKKKLNTPPKEKSRRVVKEKKPRRAQVIRRKKSVEKVATTNVKVEIKKEIPDAIASIIGTAETAVKKEVLAPGEKGGESESTEITYDKPVVKLEPKTDVEDALEFETINSETLSAPETQDLKNYDDPVTEEEVKLEKFDQPEDNRHEEVIDRIKEVINKLEDGLNQADSKPNVISPKVEIKPAIKDEVVNTADIIKPITEKVEPKDGDDKPRKDLPKVKKGKKLRLLQEKKVKKQVEKVKCELEEMKRQMAEMKRQMIEKTEQLKCKETEMPESFLLPGEWCCKWVNGQPLGTVSEVEAEAKLDANNKPILPRRSVQVEDKRLPPGWTKHMVRRSFGHSAGKWDVVMVNPENRRFHTKTDMRAYFENNDCDDLKPYENALYDFGVHLKLSRRMGWYTTTPDGLQENPIPVPADTICSSSPLVKKKNLSLRREKKDRKIKKIKKEKRKEKKKKMRLKLKRLQREQIGDSSQADSEFETGVHSGVTFEDSTENQPPLEDGYVYVGSLKVQVNGTLLRCPVDGCFKNFRNNTLLKMHITHYHRQMKKMLGNTPRVLDLAYARTKPTEMEIKRMKLEAQKNTIKIKLPKLPKRYTEPKTEPKDIPEAVAEPSLPIKIEGEKIPRSLDSPKLRLALANRPVKRPKVLLPVRRVEPEVPNVKEEEEDQKPIEPVVEVPPMENLDFETEISTHTVTKPADCRRKGDKKKKFASIAKTSEDEDWSDVETRSSFPRSGTPDSKSMDQKLHLADYNDEKQDPNYVYVEETGERIKVVRMKREEIINCHCGFREEDGLMVQCELCLCWQHAICHNIQRESEVPEKYTCSICLNPRRGRRSQRFLHDQDRLYEGLLPGAKPCETLRRSHELSGNLLRIEDALQALKVKYYVATKKDHPKLYLWAKDWEANEVSLTQERLNSDYSGLHVMVSGGVGKENMPLGSDLQAPSSDDQDDRLSSRLGPLSGVLGGLLGGDEPLDLPITASDLEQLADTVQDQDRPLPLPLPLPPVAPEPEPAIEDGACRERLLRHIQRCQALVDARLDSIEAQVAELESQDPSFEDDETANYFPRTKQTVQMLMRDLDTMEELGNIA